MREAGLMLKWSEAQATSGLLLMASDPRLYVSDPKDLLPRKVDVGRDALLAILGDDPELLKWL